MRRALLIAAGGLGALLVWLIVTVPLSLRVLRVDPVEPVAGAPPAPVIDPARPTAAVLLSQAGTEITDFLAPWAILSASGAFNVVAVAAEPGVAPTNGRLGIVPQQTLVEFDAAHPGGADLVVVPNILDPENPTIAIGHPLGASGMRLTHTVSRQLHLDDQQFGIASACVGGGQGMAILVERA